MCNITGSKSTLNLAGTQTASADVYTLYFAVNNCAHTLDIRLPYAFGLQMGMADIHARLRAFCTDFTNTCHVFYPLFLLFLPKF